MTREANCGIGVLLAAAHRIVLSGLQRLIDDEKPHLRVIATADCGETAVRLACAAKPDVAVVDVNLLEGPDDEIVRALVKGHCARVLILSEAKSRKLHEAAILSGACGVVDKSEPLQLSLEPGAYVLLCNRVVKENGDTESHYAMGMHAAFTVE